MVQLPDSFRGPLLPFGGGDRAAGDCKEGSRELDQLYHRLQVEEEANGSGTENFAALCEAIADKFYHLGRSREQIKFLNRAIKARGPAHPGTADRLAQLSEAYSTMGNHPKEKEVLERLLGVQVSRCGHGSVEVARVQARLGDAHGCLGNLQEKLRRLNEAWQSMSGQASGAEAAKLLENLGCTYLQLNWVQQAVEAFSDALDETEAYYGYSHPQLVPALVRLSEACDKTGDESRSLALLERALSLVQQELGGEHAQATEILDKLGSLHVKLGNLGKAFDVLEHSLKIKEKGGAENAPQVASTLVHLSSAHGEHGNQARRAEMLFEAESLLERTCGSQHPQTLEVKRLILDMDAVFRLAFSLVDPVVEWPIWTSIDVPLRDGFTRESFYYVGKRPENRANYLPPKKPEVAPAVAPRTGTFAELADVPDELDGLALPKFGVVSSPASPPPPALPAEMDELDAARTIMGNTGIEAPPEFVVVPSPRGLQGGLALPLHRGIGGGTRDARRTSFEDSLEGLELQMASNDLDSSWPGLAVSSPSSSWPTGSPLGAVGNAPWLGHQRSPGYVDEDDTPLSL